MGGIIVFKGVTVWVGALIILVNSSLFHVYALKCYRCNETELYSKKCVAENAEVVVCRETEQCGFGRTKPAFGRSDVNGCEFQLQCDSDRNLGVSCLTCDTDFCNLHRTSLASRIQNYEPEPIQLREPVTEANLPVAARVDPFINPNFGNPFLTNPGQVQSQVAYQNSVYNPYFNPFYSAILLNPLLAQALGYSGATGIAAGNLGLNAYSNSARVDGVAVPSTSIETVPKKHFAQQRLDSPGKYPQSTPGVQFAQLPFLLPNIPLAVPASLPSPVLQKLPPAPIPVRGVPVPPPKANLPVPPTIPPMVPNNRLKGDPELLEGEVMVDETIPPVPVPSVPVSPATIEFNHKNIKRPDESLLPPRTDIEPVGVPAPVPVIVQPPHFSAPSATVLQPSNIPYEFEPRPFIVSNIQQKPAPIKHVENKPSPNIDYDYEISVPAIDLQPPKYPDGTLPVSNLPAEPIVIVKPTSEAPRQSSPTNQRPITTTVPSSTRYTQRPTNKPRYTMPQIRRVTTSRGTRPTISTTTPPPLSTRRIIPVTTTTALTTPVRTTTRPTLAEEITTKALFENFSVTNKISDYDQKLTTEAGFSSETKRPPVGENVENQNKNHLLNQVKVPSIYYEPPKIRYPYNVLDKINTAKENNSQITTTTTKRPVLMNRLTLPPVKIFTNQKSMNSPTIPETSSTVPAISSTSPASTEKIPSVNVKVLPSNEVTPTNNGNMLPENNPSNVEILLQNIVKLPTTATTVTIPPTRAPISLPPLTFPAKTILKMVEETAKVRTQTTTKQPVPTISVPTPPRIILPPQIVGGITDEPSEVEKEVLAELGQTVETDRGTVDRQEDPASNTIGRAIGSKRIFRVNGPISFPTQTGESGVMLQVNGQTGHQDKDVNLSKDNPAQDTPPAIEINKHPGPVTFVKALSRVVEPPEK